jgi:hypothetical protein
VTANTVDARNVGVVDRMPSEARSTSRDSHWFFGAVSAFYLAGVLIGFTPTFYLRRHFNRPPLPAYLYVHGVVLTAWFALQFVQTTLIATHRTALHRRLGVVGVIVAGLVAVISPVILIRFVPRAFSSGGDPSLITRFVFGEFAGLLAFVVLVAAGVYFRQQPAAHKRFMLLASLNIVGPAIGRIAGSDIPTPAVLIGVLIIQAAYDRIRLGRVHWDTKWAVSVFVIVSVLGFGIAFTRLGQAIITALR